MHAAKNMPIALFAACGGLAQADVLVSWGDGSQGRVAHPSRSEAWGRDSLRPKPRSESSGTII